MVADGVAAAPLPLAAPMPMAKTSRAPEASPGGSAAPPSSDANSAQGGSTTVRLDSNFETTVMYIVVKTGADGVASVGLGGQSDEPACMGRLRLACQAPPLLPPPGPALLCQSDEFRGY